jgi:hypothetical protein
MSLTRFIVPCVAVAALSLVAGTAGAEELKKLGEKHGCVVYKGEMGETGISKVVAKCEWDISAEAMIKVVSNVDMHDDWLSAVAECKSLGDDRYMQVHQASGISDRQITLKFTNEKRSDGGFRTSWTRDADQEPLGDGRILAKVDDGYWDVTPNGDGKTKVEYGLLYDPAGRVPKWIVNSFQKGGTMDTLGQMKAAAQK